MKIGDRVRLNPSGRQAVDEYVTRMEMLPIILPDIFEDEVGVLVRQEVAHPEWFHCRFTRCTILVSESVVELVSAEEFTEIELRLVSKPAPWVE